MTVIIESCWRTVGKKTIELPPKLPGELDLKQIDRQLKAGEAVLDWSEVVCAIRS